MTTKEFHEMREYTKDLVETYFPRLKQANPLIASPNHRGEAIALVTGFLIKLATMIKD